MGKGSCLAAVVPDVIMSIGLLLSYAMLQKVTRHAAYLQPRRIIAFQGLATFPEAACSGVCFLEPVPCPPGTFVVWLPILPASSSSTTALAHRSLCCLYAVKLALESDPKLLPSATFGNTMALLLPGVYTIVYAASGPLECNGKDEKLRQDLLPSYVVLHKGNPKENGNMGRDRMWE